MGNQRIAIWSAVAALLCGCGGAAPAKKYSGGITLAASGSWHVVASDGSTNDGTETFNAHCTNNGDGVGEFTASFTMHQTLTDANNGQTAVTDVSGSTDQALTAANTGCRLGSINSAKGTAGVQFTLMTFDVTGQVVAGGVSLPIDKGWSSEDIGFAGSFSSDGFAQPQSGSSGAVTGMFSFSGGDVVSGEPSMIGPSGVQQGILTGIPETVSWSYAPLN